MSRKRPVLFAALACAALAAAGVAAAHDGVPGVTPAAATFDAATVSNVTSSTCTAGNGDTLLATAASYSGTATSTDPRLNGPLVLEAHSLVDTTTGAGVVVGHFEIGPDGSSDGGHFEAALSGTSAAGLAEAELQSPEGHLLASFSATFDPQAGFSGGSLGGGTAPGAGVVLSHGEGCAAQDGGGDGGGSSGSPAHHGHGHHSSKHSHRH